MVELLKDERNFLYPLCEGKKDIELWSCIEGNMGRAWTDRKDNPSAAVVLVADFLFLLGYTEDVKEAADIIKLLGQFKRRIIVLYDNRWGEFIERNFPDNHKKFSRYALKREPEVFKRDRLENFIKAVEPEFHIDKIDASNYNIVLADELMADCCSNFSSLEDFLKNGIGYLIIRDGLVISAASSYDYCKGSIDITIGTQEEYRKRGLALAVASKLILACLDRNIYPVWDAANMESVALAEKLGYHFEKEYQVYSIR